MKAASSSRPSAARRSQYAARDPGKGWFLHFRFYVPKKSISLKEVRYGFQKTQPSIGSFIATAIATTVADPKVFRSERKFAAWLGLVPRQSSTGGKTRLGNITKRGNRYLRRLLINGASANVR